ncbi:hypothetical protein [Candidatus Phytoplasma sp. AldY-WA1]|uniref:hypothetical protein n=1 Tax=Candidatus Phytoplasma sp. AldY-WA1 TaxID=2852100 RepID=UPI00254B84E2|nr:hypothetical protein [Candidatus Phytoplasma sp. AldY-WA1]
MENNCYIKPGVYYSHDTIRDKFGYYSQTVYDEKNNKLWYKYTKRWLFDSCIYDTNGKIIFNNVETYETSDHYYDTLPSPIKNRH